MLPLKRRKNKISNCKALAEKVPEEVGMIQFEYGSYMFDRFEVERLLVLISNIGTIVQLSCQGR